MTLLDKLHESQRVLRRRFLLRSLLLCAVLTLALWTDESACPLPSAQSASPEATTQWRRTSRGWEPRRAWPDPQGDLPRPIRGVHPSLLAGLQLLASLGSLLAFPPRK